MNTTPSGGQSGQHQMHQSSLSERVKRGPPLASIESLLSFEAKSTPRQVQLKAVSSTKHKRNFVPNSSILLGQTKLKPHNIFRSEINIEEVEDQLDHLTGSSGGVGILRGGQHHQVWSPAQV